MPRKRTTLESAEIVIAALRELGEGLDEERDDEALEVAARMLAIASSAARKLATAAEARRTEVLLRLH